MGFFPNGMIRYVFHDTYMPAVFLLYRILIWPEKKTTLISQPQAFFQATQILLYYQVINKIKTFSFIVSLFWHYGLCEAFYQLQGHVLIPWAIVMLSKSVWLLSLCQCCCFLCLISLSWWSLSADEIIPRGGEWMYYWTELRMFTS